jgi:uncharacterized repeat protein (TIGR01451 family)
MNITQAISSLCAALMLITVSSGQATLPGIDIRTVAEVETKLVENGREIVRLLPANRVVPGDSVIYTIEIRNVGSSDAVAPTVTRPIPNHMAYVADSATGPGADITYSVDGRTFDRPDGLAPAKAADYTHIRWQFRTTLKSKSVAFARFRAVVK